jgi:hypothetical protein
VKEIFHIYLKLFNGEIIMQVQMIELEEVLMNEVSDEAIEKVGGKNPNEASSYWVSSACCGT